MININILRDEGLQEVCNKFISSLLPHENYDSYFYSDTLLTLLKYIHADEFNMEYRMIISALVSLNLVKTNYSDFVPRLTEDSFSGMLKNSITEVITDPIVGVEEWLESERLTSNLEIAKVKKEACEKLYTRSIELYNECYELGVKSSEVFNYIPELKSAFLSYVNQMTIETQVRIMNSSVRVGRTVYSGAESRLEYSKSIDLQISERLDDSSDDNLLVLKDPQEVRTLLEDLSTAYIPIAKYGIPQFDDKTPILRHRLVTLVAKENVGKTMLAIDWSANVLAANGKVLYMCGETTKSKVIASIIISYIKLVYDISIDFSHLGHINECPEEIQKVIGLAIAKITDSGSLSVEDSFTYNNLYTEMRDTYDKFKFDFCVIDHSLSLKGNVGDNSDMSKVDKLSIDTRFFKKDYPVCILVTSHPSTLANEQIMRGKQVTASPTRSSQKLSAESDEIFILRETESLKKDGLLIIDNYKRRDAPKVSDSIILEKQFNVCRFNYNEKLQANDTSVSVSAEDAFNSVMKGYEEDDDAYNLE